MHEEIYAEILSILIEIQPKRAEIGRPSSESSKRTRIETPYERRCRVRGDLFERIIQENKD